MNFLTMFIKLQSTGITMKVNPLTLYYCISKYSFRSGYLLVLSTRFDNKISHKAIGYVKFEVLTAVAKKISIL
jgi:hypothetical protein